MGQAFDRDGNVLGEAYGDTKSEVLEKLERAHADAAEIRIKEVLAAADDPLLRFFKYEHLPARLQSVSEPFCELADHIVGSLPRNAERAVALRKLLEAKDCAVRAMLE